MTSELSAKDSHPSFNESAVSAMHSQLGKNADKRSSKKKFTVNKKPKALPLVKCHKYFRDLLLGLDYCNFFHI